MTATMPVQRAARRSEHGARVAQEVLLEQQVLRRVARDRQLGEEHELGARVAGLGDPGRDPLLVAAEVPDDAVQLGEGEAHARDPIRSRARASTRRSRAGPGRPASRPAAGAPRDRDDPAAPRALLHEHGLARVLQRVRRRPRQLLGELPRALHPALPGDEDDVARAQHPGVLPGLGGHRHAGRRRRGVRGGGVVPAGEEGDQAEAGGRGGHERHRGREQA
jgi:hypothetical protein